MRLEFTNGNRSPARAPGAAFALSLGFAVALSLTLARPPSLAAAPARDAREMQAREAFAAGRYQEALDLFVKLYADKLHPNYLRNIGRCYQNLSDPDKAIASFREYLRKAKNITADERAEIDGYIREMEELKRTRAAPSTPADPALKPAPAGTVALTSPAAPPAPPPPPPSMVETRPLPESPAPSASSPFYQRWWFWTAVGAVVVAGAAGLVASGALSGSKDPPCGAGRLCHD